MEEPMKELEEVIKKVAEKPKQSGSNEERLKSIHESLGEMVKSEVHS